MQLLDVLSQQDKRKYQIYLQKAIGFIDVDVDKSLTYWNKNKRTMYKALGGKLRLSMPVEIKVDKHDLNHKLTKVLPKMTLSHNLPDFFRYNKILNRINNFPYRFAKYLYDSKYLTEENFKNFLFLFAERNLLSGYTCLNETINLLDVKICNGARTIKIIGKLVRKTGYDIADFEEWRNKISDITTIQRIKQNLVLSIHPLDFLSLSDNASGWDSCYSLLKHNMHCEAPITHMNSNCVIVAYLESKKPFEVAEDCVIPNKTYRQLFYLHKNIICGGRSYPYENVELTKKIIDILRELVYNNLGWKYQYDYQQYCDGYNFGSNSRILEEQEWYGSGRLSLYGHHIYLYTGRDQGYNDLIEHRDENFYCVRNWVPKDKYICITGPTTCINCGEVVKEGYRYKTHLLCEKCKKGRICFHCHNIKKISKVPILRLSMTYSQIFPTRKQKYFIERLEEIDMCNECLAKSYVFIESRKSHCYVKITDLYDSYFQKALQEYLKYSCCVFKMNMNPDSRNTEQQELANMSTDLGGGWYKLEFSNSL